MLVAHQHYCFHLLLVVALRHIHCRIFRYYLLLHKQGKSYREIAQEIGLSKSMVGKILKNAAPDDKNLFTEPAKE